MAESDFFTTHDLPNLGDDPGEPAELDGFDDLPDYLQDGDR